MRHQLKEVYLLSGLGADKKVFEFIDLSGFHVNHVDWIDPLDKETIEHYAKRLLEQIKTTKPILIGVSFGGMVAIEIVKQIETEKVILISSAKTKLDIPFYFRLVGLLRINRIIPTKVFKTINSLTYWFFGVKTKREKELLRSIIQETDIEFLSWAIDKIVNWKNTTTLSNLIHIHGTNDKILPVGKADYKIHGGGHLMVVSKDEELSEVIQKTLAE